MKRFFFSLVLLSMVLFASKALYAQGLEPLGRGHIGAKVAYIQFTDSMVEALDLDTGLYVGVEAFGEVAPDLYFGVEVGYAGPDEEFVELTYIPFEINLKYAVEPASGLVVDIGGGFSFNFVELEIFSTSDDDWLFGGQVFTGLSYKAGPVYLGANFKLQLTQDFEDGSMDFTNWRAGGHLGIVF
jgi:hypothetical protein